MRERWKWMLPAVLAVGVVGFFLVSHHRSRIGIEDYATAVDRYGAYANAFGGVEDHSMMTTCYGGKWDRYTKELYREMESHKNDEGYLKTKAKHFSKLREKYQAAIAHPEAEITLDPPLGP